MASRRRMGRAVNANERFGIEALLKAGDGLQE